MFVCFGGGFARANFELPFWHGLRRAPAPSQLQCWERNCPHPPSGSPDLVICAHGRCMARGAQEMPHGNARIGHSPCKGVLGSSRCTGRTSASAPRAVGAGSKHQMMCFGWSPRSWSVSSALLWAATMDGSSCTALFSSVLFLAELNGSGCWSSLQTTLVLQPWAGAGSWDASGAAVVQLLAGMKAEGPSQHRLCRA